LKSVASRFYTIEYWLGYRTGQMAMMADPSGALALPEVWECLTGLLGLDALVAVSAASPACFEHVRCDDESWKRCYSFRCSTCPDSIAKGCWRQAFIMAAKNTEESNRCWCREDQNLSTRHKLIFQSFVRSWASDGRTLVAGEYDGRLQPLDWSTETIGAPFQGRHNDEVVCVDLNQEHVLSGSGDPGYYNRPASDSSVKLWRRRDGALLGTSNHHRDTVRAVSLFPADSAFSNYGISVSMDCCLCLHSLSPFRVLRTVRMDGPCRSLKIIESPRAHLCAGIAPEIRLFASTGSQVCGFSLCFEGRGQPDLFETEDVEIRWDVSSLACHTAVSFWEHASIRHHFPNRFLDLDSFTLAGGTTDGRVWAARVRDGSPSVVSISLTRGRQRGPADVVSVQLLDACRMLAVSRQGLLALVSWAASSDMQVVWAVSGLRMYVSTIGLRGPQLLVSDGFDNAICAISCGA
ncbi:unnamed protein product, partial [Prorocentrum cordatum]